MLTHTAEISAQASARRHANSSVAKQALARAEAVHVAAMETILRRKAKLAEATGAVASAKRVSQAAKLVTRSGGTAKIPSKSYQGAPRKGRCRGKLSAACFHLRHHGPCTG